MKPAVLILIMIVTVPSLCFADNQSQAQALKAIAAKEIAIAMKSLQQDTNLDGFPDRWEYYDKKGSLIRIEDDTDKNGAVDRWSEIKDGKIVLVEKDTDGDGKPDWKTKEAEVIYAEWNK